MQLFFARHPREAGEQSEYQYQIVVPNRITNRSTKSIVPISPQQVEAQCGLVPIEGLPPGSAYFASYTSERSTPEREFLLTLLANS